MDKLARKRSPDPKQEALREKKDQWNSHTSDLINDLIALKRGLNGRGDKEKNLPPSSIKESFPPQVGAYLQDVANSAAKVIQEAKTIVQQQQEYSQTRRRRKKTSYQERELIKLAELISEASWWGSRAYSRFVSLRNMPARQRNQVVDMMYALADIKSKLKVFEDNLLKSNKKGIADSFTNLNSLIHDYASNVLKPAKKLQNILFEKPENEEFTRDLDERKDSGKKESPARESEDLDKREEQEKRNRKKRILTEDYNYLLILKDYILMPADSSFFVILDNKISSFKFKFNKYEEFHNIFTTVLPERFTSPKITETLDNCSLLHREITEIILSASFRAGLKDGKLDLNAPGAKPGTFPVIKLNTLFNSSDINPDIEDISFKTMVEKLPVQEMDEILKKEREAAGEGEGEGEDEDDVLDSQDLDGLEKQATIKSEIRAKILGINPDSFNISQVNSFKISKKSRDEINKLLDMLEEPNTTIPVLLKKINDLSAILKELSENVLDLGKSYKLYLRRTTKSKDSYLSDIKSEDLYSLKDAAYQLFVELKTTPDPKPGSFTDPTE